tara:strand:- start:4506 stop:5432 length:927 start_codon:yes stop_codon:yes gene_type:complete
MRYKEFFKEAPISDFRPMGDYDDEIDQDYYDDSDAEYYTGPAWTTGEKKKIHSKKWQNKVAKSWSKTKNNYILIPVAGEDAYNYEIIERGVVDVSEVQEDFPQGYEFLQELNIIDQQGKRTEQHQDKTVVFFLGNAAADWVATSGWMLLHRLGHGSRTTRGKENPAYTQILTQIIQGLQSIYGNFGVDIRLDANYNSSRYKNSSAWADYGLQKIMTTGSARRNKVRDRFEGLYEMWAQYLNSGSVKLKAPDSIDLTNVNSVPNPKEEQELTEMDKDILSGSIEDLEETLNEELFPAFEQSIAGEIILM